MSRKESSFAAIVSSEFLFSDLQFVLVLDLVGRALLPQQMCRETGRDTYAEKHPSHRRGCAPARPASHVQEARTLTELRTGSRIQPKLRN